MGNPLLSLKPCAFTGPCPGIGAEVFDEVGSPIRNQVGELVIRTTWIGMMRGFWKDTQGYLDTYWSRWENVWAHGDFAVVDADVVEAAAIGVLHEVKVCGPVLFSCESGGGRGGGEGMAKELGDNIVVGELKQAVEKVVSSKS